MSIEQVSDLHTLGRIITAIKVYRSQTGDYAEPSCNLALDQYLNESLSLDDYTFWQRCNVNPLAMILKAIPIPTAYA